VIRSIRPIRRMMQFPTQLQCPTQSQTRAVHGHSTRQYHLAVPPRTPRLRV